MKQIQIDGKRDVTKRTVKTADWNISYHEAGEGHPLIMIHGSGPGASGWSNYSPNIGHLAVNFRVLAIDLPGWGESSAAPVNVANSVEAVLQFMDAMDLAQAAIVGNSMGGMVALKVAAQFPDRISHLITMGSGTIPGLNVFSPGGSSEGIKVLVQGYKDPSEDSMRRLAAVMTYDPNFATDGMIRERSAAAQSRPDHLANYLEGIRQPGYMPVPTLEELRNIQAPSLFIHGRDDRVVHYENSLRLTTLVNNSRMYLINRCGHWAQLEHSAEFNRVVQDFLANN